MTEDTKKERAKIKDEVRKQMRGYIVGALGLVAALAWNDAIRALIDSVLPSQSGLLARFAYAVFITIAVVVLTVYISRLLVQEEEKS